MAMTLAQIGPGRYQSSAQVLMLCKGVGHVAHHVGDVGQIDSLVGQQ